MVSQIGLKQNQFTFQRSLAGSSHIHRTLPLVAQRHPTPMSSSRLMRQHLFLVFLHMWKCLKQNHLHLEKYVRDYMPWEKQMGSPGFQKWNWSVTRIIQVERQVVVCMQKSIMNPWLLEVGKYFNNSRLDCAKRCVWVVLFQLQVNDVDWLSHFE